MTEIIRVRKTTVGEITHDPRIEGRRYFINVSLPKRKERKVFCEILPPYAFNGRCENWHFLRGYGETSVLCGADEIYILAPDGEIFLQYIETGMYRITQPPAADPEPTPPAVPDEIPASVTPPAPSDTLKAAALQAAGEIVTSRWASEWDEVSIDLIKIDMRRWYTFCLSLLTEGGAE